MWTPIANSIYILFILFRCFSKSVRRMSVAEPSQASRKRKRSTVRDHFTTHDSVSSRCCWCFKIIKNHGNTTNLTSHLERMHPLKLRTEEPAEKQQGLSLISPQQFEEIESRDIPDDPAILDVDHSSSSSPTFAMNNRNLAFLGRSRSCSPQPSSLFDNRRSNSKNPTVRSVSASPIPLCKQISIDKAFDKVKSYTGKFVTTSVFGIFETLRFIKHLLFQMEVTRPLKLRMGSSI